ncbi:MAG: carbohydrate porin [Synechococcus sp. LacPavin_0920_WC12_MAG_50_7]|nr:carbohydrate porin [Synechococcus sp. LacPavin_0920_WC12_MAG_50_7]
MNGKMGCIYRVGLLILMMAPSQLCCTENQSVEFIPGAPIIAPDEPGTGQLGQLFGLSADAPVRISGLWVGNSSSQLFGGINSGGGSGLAQQALLDLRLDLGKAFSWKGASVWVQALQVNVQESAAYAAGSLNGTNNLAAAPPLNRTELYSYIFRQDLFDKQLRLMLGKQAPSTTFANVMRPITRSGATFAEPYVTGLVMTSPYAMPTLQGKLPGYPDSALGATLIFEPRVFQRSTYLEAGIYDGRQAMGVPTGLVIPSLSGPLFSIVEAGTRWSLANGEKPGSMGLGTWRQSGLLSPMVPGTNLQENGTYGSYLIASQRLINFRSKFDQSGISSFVQAGWTASRTSTMTANFGGGFTVFAPFIQRPKDSYGLGFSWAKLNNRSTLNEVWNPQELLLQGYAQVHLFGSSFITPALSYLPLSGLKSANSPSFSAIVQLVFQF